MAYSMESTPKVEDYQEEPDFFGNPTAIFKVAGGHKRFEICTESRVDVGLGRNGISLRQRALGRKLRNSCGSRPRRKPRTPSSLCSILPW